MVTKMNKRILVVCGILLASVALLVAGCVDNGIATDHANESICGTWLCDRGLANDRIFIAFFGNGTAHLADILPDQTVITNEYQWNRLNEPNSYIAVSGGGERVHVWYHPENLTIVDNAGNVFNHVSA